MTKPNFQEINSSQESLQMITSARKSQEITNFTTAATITLMQPSSVCNATNTGAYIAIMIVDDAAYRIEWFGAGQEKMRRLKLVGGIGSAANGTTCTNVFVFES